MVYLTSFSVPSLGMRERFTNDIKRRCYNTVYPFNVFELQELPEFTFEPVTILCGGNGSGKSTLLNVIAEKLGVPRGAAYNRSSFFEDYVRLCRCETQGAPSALTDGRIITSDDVFDYLLNIRTLNGQVDARREELFEEYTDAKHARYSYRSMADYEDLKKFVDAHRRTQSRYVRERLAANLPERSNGESALAFFVDAIRENALYLLDEPENSLSAERQQELVQYISDSARFYNCQFVIATHSPFILAAQGARIYDLDADPPSVRRWTDLKNVRAYYNFFLQHLSEF
ncbi:MAG: AAA family ATPase [Candidatus Faecivicinus sp.]